MPQTNIRFLRTTAALLLVGLAALAAIVGVTFWLSVQTETIAEQVVRARQMRAATVALRTLLQDAETGQRGFLLTNDPGYLEPYERARGNLAQTLERLQASGLADDGTSAELRRTIDDKMAELAETIGLAQSGRLEEALALVRTNRGKELMDRARALFVTLVERAEARLDETTRRQSDSITNLQRAVLLATLLILIVVGASAVIALRYTRELVVARRQLRTLNEDLEQRVVERTQELGQANAEIQRFAYIVGHDLRSPLVNVMGFTSELMEFRKEIFAMLADARAKAGIEPSPADLMLQKDFDEAVGFIRTSTSKMDSLINAILKLSREGKRRLVPESLDLRSLMEAAAANVRHRVDERGGEVAIAGRYPELVSDRFSLEQVFGNLFDNAVKYSEPTRPPRIVISAREIGDFVQVDVADNGRGIAPNEAERVFELFRRAGRQDQPGEGIGLAYVRAYVRRLGGDVTFTSSVGQGTTFHVRLPRVMPSEATAAA